MTDILQSLLPELTSRTILPIDAGHEAVFPSYDGYSLVNLPSTVCGWLGQPAIGASGLDSRYLAGLKKQYRHVVLMVVDGLGLDLFQPFLDRSPWKNWQPHAILAPLTSITPSTTAAALTTLWTGTTPGQHGVLGYELWLKEFSMIVNMIQHSPAAFNGDSGSLQKAGFSPQTFLPVPTLGPHLQNGGVDVFALQPGAIARSGLSTMLLGGAEVVPYRNLSDLWVTLDSLLDRQRERNTYAYVYWSDVDDLSHRFGPQDERVALEFETFSRTVQRYVRSRQSQSRGNTLWIMVADHGQIHTPLNHHLDLRNHPAFLDNLVMVPSGENRLPYIFLRPGREESARAYIEAAWPDEFLIASSAAVRSAGLFGSGKAYSQVADRLGDWVLFPQNQSYLWWANQDNPLLGRHGGLSPQEMLVPFWAMEL